MEVLEAERAEMETLFTINQQDVEKLKEQEVKRKQIWFYPAYVPSMNF